VIHRGTYLTFRVDTVELSDGRRSTRDIAGHPGAVAVVALDADDRVALVRQWRLPAEGTLLEIPAGGLDVHDDGSKEDPDAAARRELEEETGLRAGSWRKLGTFYTAPGFTDELMHLYLATDLTPAHPDDRLGPDHDERLILSWLPWRDAVAAAERGDIRDAKSIVGLFWLARLRAGDAGGAGEADARPDPFDAGSGPDVAVARYALTTREYVAANVALARRSTGMRLLGFGLLLLGVGAGALTSDWVINLPAALLGLAFVTGWFTIPFAWWQARKRRDLIEAPSAVRVDPSGLTFRTPLTTGHQGWETFGHVHDRGGFLFFDLDTGVNVVIPKRVFSPTDLATVYRLLERRGLLQGSAR
jgi:ADP-ribose pyrophosphatase